MNAIHILLLFFIYLIGSVPMGYLVVRIRKGIDIRTVGSGAIGATNVSRELGRTWGIIVAILDIVKGLLAGSIAIFFFEGILWEMGLAVFLVVLGHVYPAFIRFKGGKGVATFAGSLLPFLALCLFEFPHPWTYAGFVGVIGSWFLLHKLLKRMGLSSILLMGLIIVYFGGLLLFTGFTAYFTVTVFIMVTAIFVVVNHRGNIVRLWNGKEPKTDLA
jgi:glycerol-3-phosphate acyltransferase PlsY